MLERFLFAQERSVPILRLVSVGLSILPLFLGPPNASAQSFVDLSAQVTIKKSGLVLNRATNTFNAVITVTNTSTAVINTPLVLSVTNIAPTNITLANPAGQGPSGTPYVNLTVPANGLPPGKSISNVLLEFSDQGRIGFTFALSVANIVMDAGPLPTGVVGPLIDSSPPTAAVVGKPMQYQVVASSANPSGLIFSLSAAPVGMSVDPATGLVTWIPGPSQAGDQSVTIIAQDSAGQNSQSFTLSVFGIIPKTSTTISAASGGVITVNDTTSAINGLSLNIPAGALQTDTTLTISELISPPTLGGSAHFWMQGFLIDPDETLSVPATVTLPYDPTHFGAQNGIPLESFLGVYFVQTSTGNLQFLKTYTINKTNHTLTAILPHFSSWVNTNAARLCPPIGEPNCPGPASYTPASQSLLLPVIMIHGFQPGGLGNESTWGNLRTLLGNIDKDPQTNVPGPGRIDAWRFDWDSRYVPFELSGYFLQQAVEYVKSIQTSPPQPPLQQGTVNLVAHSFGGILARTYLQGKAINAPYNDDIIRVMTLGTPHSGIGQHLLFPSLSLSTLPADFCAAVGGLSPLTAPTCFEMYTAKCPQANGSPGACATGEGQFLANLNATALPALLGTESPSYWHIKGSVLSNPVAGFGSTLLDNDGLITLAGAQLCGGLPTNVCSGADVQEETIPTYPSTSAFGLCHSGALGGTWCPGPTGASAYNIPMAEINDTSHILWSKVCQFLGCAPSINITVSNPSAGTVTSDVGGINCGSTCSAVYAGSTTSKPITVTLTARPIAGFSFSGWSGSGAGSCTTQTTCQITISTDLESAQSPLFTGYQIAAVFNVAPPPSAGYSAQINSISCIPPKNDFDDAQIVLTGEATGPSNSNVDIFLTEATTPDLNVPVAYFLPLNCGDWTSVPFGGTANALCSNTTNATTTTAFSYQGYLLTAEAATFGRSSATTTLDFAIEDTWSAKPTHITRTLVTTKTNGVFSCVVQ